MKSKRFSEIADAGRLKESRSYTGEHRLVVGFVRAFFHQHSTEKRDNTTA